MGASEETYLTSRGWIPVSIGMNPVVYENKLFGITREMGINGKQALALDASGVTTKQTAQILSTPAFYGGALTQQEQQAKADFNASLLNNNTSGYAQTSILNTGSSIFLLGALAYFAYRVFKK